MLNNSYYADILCDEHLTQLCARIEEANAEDMVFVASAGQTPSSYPAQGNNDKHDHYPSNFYYLPNVISVTAISRKGTLSESSNETANYGKNSVLLGAPGSSIYSTLWPEATPYGTKTGTSMAAAFVSGTAALLLSVPGCSELSAHQVKERILDGGITTRAISGKTVNGRLNIYRSIEPCATLPKIGNHF